jgi:hypothetical protein
MLWVKDRPCGGLAVMHSRLNQAKNSKEIHAGVREFAPKYRIFS